MSASAIRLGCIPSSSGCVERTGDIRFNNSQGVARSPFPADPTPGRLTPCFRFNSMGLGRPRFGGAEPDSARTLEFQHHTHKPQGTRGSHSHNNEFVQTKHLCFARYRQHRSLFIPSQVWRQSGASQRSPLPLSTVAAGQQGSSPPSPSAVMRHEGRCDLAPGARPHGVYAPPSGFQPRIVSHAPIFSTSNRHVRIPQHHPPPKFLLKMATPSSNTGGRLALQPFRGQSCLRSPPMAASRPVASQASHASASGVHDNRSLMGFRVVVAPMNVLARRAHANPQDSSSGGSVQEYSKGLHAEAQSSPDLHSVIRRVLQDKGYTETQISSHLSKHVPPKRYNTSFALLFAMAVRNNLTIDSPTDAFVGLLIDVNQFSESHARNAYSALLLIPGLGLHAPYSGTTRRVVLARSRNACGQRLQGCKEHPGPAHDLVLCFLITAVADLARGVVCVLRAALGACARR